MKRDIIHNEKGLWTVRLLRPALGLLGRSKLTIAYHILNEIERRLS